MRMVLMIAALLVCGGCLGIPVFTGGQKSELNQTKNEARTDQPLTIHNKFPSGTTAMEAAQANSILLKSMAELKRVTDEAEVRQAEAMKQLQSEQVKSTLATEKLIHAQTWADKWKDRFMWSGIAAAVLLIAFPSVVGILWTQVKRLRGIILVQRGDMTPEQVAAVDAKLGGPPKS